MRPIYLVINLLFTISTFAQAPKIIGKTPAAQLITAQATENINIVFDQALDPNSVNENSLKVFGRWSGPMQGEITLQNNDQEILFTPSNSFFAGEWVTVTLTKSIATATGETMSTGYSWNYWIATAPGVLDQPLEKTLTLRNFGEQLIQAYGAYAGDLNDDGYSDLTVVNETSDDLRIFMNDGQGNYWNYEFIEMGNSTPSPNEGGDFNNDGLIDLAISTAHDDQIRILTGDGEGGFSDLQVYESGNGARGVVVLDCNGDGNDDLLVTNRLADNITMLTNDGTGNFTTSTMNTTGIGETSCAVTDINNDGIPDVFFATYESSEVGILIGDGNGGFEMTTKVLTPGRPWMIAAGDLNGDGFADVASANSTGNISVVLFGDGAGGLSSPQELVDANDRFPLAIDLGDLDGDGDLDIVTSNYSSASYSIFENSGSGDFTLAATLEAPNLASCAILHDRDNDGDLDISATDEGDDVVLLFKNELVNDVETTVDNEFNLMVTPNPINAETTISFELETATNGFWRIIDVQGKLVEESRNQLFNSGINTIVYRNVAQLSNGVYFFELSLENKVISKKIVVKH